MTKPGKADNCPRLPGPPPLKAQGSLCGNYCVVILLILHFVWEYTPLQHNIKWHDEDIKGVLLFYLIFSPFPKEGLCVKT